MCIFQVKYATTGFGNKFPNLRFLGLKLVYVCIVLGLKSSVGWPMTQICTFFSPESYHLFQRFPDKVSSYELVPNSGYRDFRLPLSIRRGLTIPKNIQIIQ